MNFTKLFRYFPAILLIGIFAAPILSSKEQGCTPYSFSAQAEEVKVKAIRDNWDFKFKEFVIGAWWGPEATDADMAIYKEAEFNVVMSGRYMQLNNYSDANKGLKELDLAQKYDLGVMFDTYTKNESPWGGKTGPTDEHPLHHPASLVELKWLYKKVGNHPALIGFLLGDDQGSMSQRAIDCTKFLFEQEKPHLMPWLCGWISPKDLAEHNNPISNPQIYPTLYQWELPAEDLAQQYCLSFARYSRQCQEQDIIFWPMINVGTNSEKGYCPSSLVRFPAYAALAYGAEGIWYFTYAGPLRIHGEYKTEDEVRKALTPLYPVVKKINHRISNWGTRLLGRKSSGIFSTAFSAIKKSEWPFPEDVAKIRTPEAIALPEKDKIVEAMSKNLLVGILTKPGKSPFAMIVDCRVSKNFDELPSREVSVQFALAVKQFKILEDNNLSSIKGRKIKLSLKSGEGQLLELEGKDLAPLCSSEAIYRVAANKQKLAEREITEKDLKTIKAAKIRIDVFGSDDGPKYQPKRVYLNQQQFGVVPANNRDSWSLIVIDFASDQLSLVKLANEVKIHNANLDAWKFRNLTLAVQLIDGTWVKTDTERTTYSAADWAYGEGVTWGKDGVVGPIQLKFE